MCFFVVYFVNLIMYLIWRDSSVSSCVVFLVCCTFLYSTGIVIVFSGSQHFVQLLLPWLLYLWNRTIRLVNYLYILLQKNTVHLNCQLFIYTVAFGFWRYLTRGLIWHLSQSSIRPSIYFSSNPFLEPTSTQQEG